MPITSLDRSNINDIQDRAIRALEREFANDNLNVRFAGGKWDPNNFTLKTTISVIGENGVVQTPIVADFPRICHQFGLRPEDQNRFFMSQGVRFQLIGIKARAHKTPFIARNEENGKLYRFRSVTPAQLHGGLQ